MKKKTIFLPLMAATMLLVACQQQGGGGGGGGNNITPHGEDEEPIAVLHMEDADHYSADGDWSGSGRGPGETPIYEKSSASDGTCVAYFGEGDKETLKFTSDKAISAELCITMGNNSSFESLAEVEEVKFNGKAINLEEVGYESDGSSGDYTFHEVSFGRIDIKAGENVLAFEFLASAPYLDDVNIYSKTKAAIAVVPAAQKEKIVVTNEESSLTIEAEGTVQLVTATTGVSYASSNENVATVSDSGLVTGVAKGTATITVSKEGMLSAKVTITVLEKLIEGEIRVEAETGKVGDYPVSADTDVKIRTASSGETLTERWAAGATLTVTFNATAAGSYKLYINARAAGQYGTADVQDIAAVMEVKVNTVALTLPENTAITGRSFVDCLLGNVTLKSGENKIEVKSLGDENTVPNIDFFKFIPVAA